MVEGKNVAVVHDRLENVGGSAEKERERKGAPDFPLARRLALYPLRDLIPQGAPAGPRFWIPWVTPWTAP